MTRAGLLLPGIALSALIAAAGVALAQTPILSHWGLNALTLAIVLGMLAGNAFYPEVAPILGRGVEFSKQYLLRLGIILYGLRLTLAQVAQMGAGGLWIDAIVVASTFALALYAGCRWLKLDRTTASLIGIGSAICGAAAVLAAEPVMRARAEQVAVAIATVVVFGTLALFLYPILFQWNLEWQLVPGGVAGFGRYTGSTIHEVAQVVAAGRAVGEEAADTAIVAKMVRVMMLAPFLLLLAFWLRGRGAGDRAAPDQTATACEPTAHRARIPVPWFALGFIAMVFVRSTVEIPAASVQAINDADTFLLAVAMAALGLTTHASALRRAGLKPLLLAALLFAWLTVGGALINCGVDALSR